MLLLSFPAVLTTSAPMSIKELKTVMVLILVFAFGLASINSISLLHPDGGLYFLTIS